MRKGIPTSQRGPGWHKKHAKKLNKRKHHRKVKKQLRDDYKHKIRRKRRITGSATYSIGAELPTSAKRVPLLWPWIVAAIVLVLIAIILWK